MNITDYLIEQENHDWDALLSEWGYLLPSSFTLWLVNLLGDLIIVNTDDEVLFIDVGNGTSDVIAKSREEFAQLLDIEDNANHWLAIPLVESCKAKGLILSEGECYGFKMPPILGGSYEPENLVSRKVASNYQFLIHIHNQIKDLPDGAKIKISFSDGAE